MNNVKSKKYALVTGSAGFIGFHVSKALLEMGFTVIGFDSLSEYYDISLKQRRESILNQYPNYISIHSKLEEPGALLKVFQCYEPYVVVHLAAQAGVRHSIENPRSYFESNALGTFELLEAMKIYPPSHTLIASTSSAYGSNVQMPYRETDKADNQISFYAATKKATENFAHSYSHIHNLPITIFRFFTVYGPWGRPDMALFKFVKAILEGEAIEVYNYGEMNRDFTYIDDLVESIIRLLPKVPIKPTVGDSPISRNDSLSNVAPCRVVNIGNSQPIPLVHFINAIEKSLGIKAEKLLLPMQQGDVAKTYADTDLLKSLIDFAPNTHIQDGVDTFVKWFREYYNI